ncbi:MULTISPECIES: LysR family transcriptional regulator [unclassified Mesorhizobium]|uniref:LysR family transcriptional regulator n=1 Tax=unclassified Mesorhizobium TaxID=325217 RepID=UPI0026A94867
MELIFHAPISISSSLFEAVLEEHHVGRVADRLYLTPSAVSHGLGRLRRLFNDPMFLRTPKGVVPTARATELAAPIAVILARVRSVMATAAPFDPATAVRRFAIGAPDGVSSRDPAPASRKLSRIAPRLEIGVRQLLPSPARAWRSAIVDLEAHAINIAIIPSDDIPPRFEKRCIYEEDFVIAMRLGHPFARDPTLERYCDMQHLVVSHSGDPYGFVDEQLAKQGRARRIALTVPNFMFALAVIAETDLISALPRRFVTMHAARFGVLSLDAPLPLPGFRLNAVAPKVAMMDAGVAWLFDLLAGVEPTAQKHHSGLPALRR